MPNILHTNSAHSDFQMLAVELEKELFERDGDLADVNYELNKVELMENAVVLYVNDVAAACGAYRILSDDTIELKRMYVAPQYRRNNYASKILSELESIAKQNGFRNAVLETGKNQPEAIAFYLKHGYSEIEKFGKYVGSENSVCFGKEISIL